jgi:hypothetical protein
MGRTGGHQWGDSTAAYGENLMAAVKGDAYDRCLERGSEDPAGDLTEALRVADQRELSA